MKPFSLPKERVLKKPEEFGRLIRRGRRIEGERINLYYLPAGKGTGLVGFTTVRKLGRAVDRNRARRLMREVFRIHQGRLRKGNDYLFQWKGSVAPWKFADAEKDMLFILAREGLIQ